jgi:hypothetical protein
MEDEHGDMTTQESEDLATHYDWNAWYSQDS